MEEKKQERVADIVAEMRTPDIRATANCVSKHEREKYQEMSDWLAGFADRIEAAMKREEREWEAAISAALSDAIMSGKVAVVHTPVGNAAVMRETLVALQARFEKNVMAYQDRYFKFTGWHWHKKAKEAARWRDVFSELNEQCKSALATPPRNCDRYEGAAK